MKKQMGPYFAGRILLHAIRHLESWEANSPLPEWYVLLDAQRLAWSLLKQL